MYTIKTIKVNLKIAEENLGKVSSSADAHPVLKAWFDRLDADQEHFVILALDVKNNIKGIKTLFSGATDQSLIDIKIVFRNALLMGASRLIFAHNHPSGDPKPSQEDYTLTEQLTKAGKILQIDVVDHIVIGNGNYFAMGNKD